MYHKKIQHISRMSTNLIKLNLSISLFVCVTSQIKFFSKKMADNGNWYQKGTHTFIGHITRPS
jgi:hypothetical protein